MTPSEKYKESLVTHINAVREFGASLGVAPELLDAHDASKFSTNEFDAYAQYWHGDPPHQNAEEFQAAWLHHIHNNPHHWQHFIDPMGPRKVWALPNGGATTRPTGKAIHRMPDRYALEMIADWAGSSMAYTGSYDMTDWLMKNIPVIYIHRDTAAFVRGVLRRLNYDDVVKSVNFPA